MERVYIQRVEFTASGTFGKIIVDKQLFFTAELPWRDNKPMISCIPEGVYECSWTYSSRFKRYTYLVEDVDGRAGIRFHPANFVGDREKGFKAEVDGCISLGLAQGFMNGQRAVLGSAKAVKAFENYLAEEPFILEIFK